MCLVLCVAAESAQGPTIAAVANAAGGRPAVKMDVFGDLVKYDHFDALNVAGGELAVVAVVSWDSGACSDQGGPFYSKYDEQTNPASGVYFAGCFLRNSMVGTHGGIGAQLRYSQVYVDDPDFIPEQKFHVLTMRRTAAGELEVRADGQTRGSKAGVTGIYDNNEPIRLGNARAQLQNQFRGYIAHVLVLANPAAGEVEASESALKTAYGL